MAAATVAALLAGGASSGGASAEGAPVGARPGPHRPQQGGGGGGPAAEEAAGALRDQKRLLKNIERFLPRELQLRIGRLAHAIAVRQREQDRAIGEAVVIIHAVLEDYEDEAREESEFEREEQVRFDMDVEREIEIERADEETHAEIAWDAAHMHGY